jgi:hypothetical protein
MRNLEPQRREVARLVSLREQGERQLGDVEARLGQKRLDLQRLQDEIKASEEQKQKVSQVIVPGASMVLPTMKGSISRDDRDNIQSR